MLTAGDEYNVMPGLEEASANGATDSAGAVNDVPQSFPP